MKLLILSLALVSFGLEAKMQKVIYGKDSRFEAAEYPNQKYINFSKSVAGRVSKWKLQNFDETYFDFYKTSIGDAMGMCSTERFREQVSLPDCTGFLVGKDILVTAGHCMVSANECESNQWVFDYTKGVEKIKKENTYNCVEIISQSAKYNALGYAKDYAVIRLDREVKGRTPLKFRTRGKIRRGTEVLVIGHPSGLPLKIADDATVKNTFGLTFKANLDTYGGNSGSPVFNVKKGVVEGILIQGAEDYVSAGGCMVSNVLEKGKDEKVFKINKIKELKDMYKDGRL